MEIALLVAVGIGLGLAVNWLADHLPAGHPQRRAIAANATCPRCGASHRTGYWIALWQFIWHRRVCPVCNLRPRFRPVVVILLVATLPVFLWKWTAGDVMQFGVATLVASIFLLVSVIDLEHHLILQKVTVPSAVVIGLAQGLAVGWPVTLRGGLMGFGVMLAVYVVGVLLFKGHGMGAGDVVLSGLAGLAVGADRVLPALVMAMIAGGAVAFTLLAWGRIRNQSIRSHHLPYGPFIVMGTALVWGMV